MTTVRRREKENRRDRRQEIRLSLNYQNNSFNIIDLSLGGLAISAEAAAFIESQEVEAVLKKQSTGESEENIDISLLVKRVDHEKNEVGFQFRELSEKQFSILESYLTGRALQKKTPLI
ncbi:MAG: PilZ domain-containing protein [Rhodospirillaceae bacterium]|nr:PilZ domain-containing protein [Rhodospirillaceae bacterium]